MENLAMDNRPVQLPTPEEVSQRIYQPYIALVMSKTPKHDDTQARLELFQITGARLHSPRTVSAKDMRSLIDAIDEKADQPKFKGWLPPEVFWMRGASMAFYLSPGIRRAFFRGEDGKPEEVLLWLPAMVFRYAGPDHQLWAYFCTGTLDELRDDKARLVGALLPNISRGSVCLGSSMTKSRFEEDPGEMMEVIIERFFGSTFNEWRYQGMRELIEQFIDIAKEPELDAEVVHAHFWKNTPKMIKDHTAKEDPWKRPSHLFG